MDFELDLGTLSNVDGSAELHLGGLKVVCGINGPMEAMPRQEVPNSSYLEVIIRPDVGAATTREKLMESYIKSFLKSVIITNLYPRQVIQINLQILEKNKKTGTLKEEDFLPELNCCINATFLALLDANITVHQAFNSNIFSYTHNNTLVLGNVENAKSSHLVVYGIKNNKIEELLFSENNGRFSEKKIFEVLNQGEINSLLLHSNFRQVVAESIKEKFVYLN